MEIKRFLTDFEFALDHWERVKFVEWALEYLRRKGYFFFKNEQEIVEDILSGDLDLVRRALPLKEQQDASDNPKTE